MGNSLSMYIDVIPNTKELYMIVSLLRVDANYGTYLSEWAIH